MYRTGHRYHRSDIVSWLASVGFEIICVGLLGVRYQLINRDIIPWCGSRSLQEIGRLLKDRIFVRTLAHCRIAGRAMAARISIFLLSFCGRLQSQARSR